MAGGQERILRRRIKSVESTKKITRAMELIAACCALRIFEAATICIALVICAVLLIDLMRRRMSRVPAIPRSRSARSLRRRL